MTPTRFMHFQSNLVTSVAATISWCCLCVWSTVAVAMGPDQAYLSLPERGAKPAGFTVAIVCEDMRLFGEVPVHVRINTTSGPFAADRSLILRISPTPRTTQPPGRDCIYDLPIQLSQGASALEQTFYLPKWSVGGELEVAVIQDRRPIPGYTGKIPGAPTTPNQADMFWLESAESRVAWIVEDDADQPDARVLMAMLAPELLSINDIQASSGFAFGDAFRQFRVVKGDDLPVDWRGFDAADVWVIESLTLAMLFKKYPAAGLALRKYLLCGGNLWIIGDIADEKLDSMLGLPPANPGEYDRAIATAVDSFLQYPDLSRYNEYKATQSTSYGLARAYLRELTMRRSSGRPFGTQPSASGMQPSASSLIDQLFDDNLAWLESQQQSYRSGLTAQNYLIRSLGLGKIIVCRSDEPLPGTPDQWLVMVALTGIGMSETASRSVDPCFGDRRYWDWIIPNVAQPPVYTFIGLLLVFTIVVGPLSYRKFTKLGRGYLMMFVAPLLAFATTLMMFAYGLVADGLATRARVREITWIGDMSQNAARYSRATYFAGVRPAEGLQFPGDAIVLPYQLPTVESWYEASKLEHSVIGTIGLGDKNIQMDSGFLPSRQQRQFITYHPLEGIGALDFRNESRSEVNNSTAMQLRDGVICDRLGNCYAFDSVEPQGNTATRPISKIEASELLSKLYTRQRPIAPAGVSSTRRQGEYTIDLIATMQSRDPRRQSGSASSGESRIEAWLRTTLQIESALTPGMFVALSDVTEDCIAVPGTELDESIHYVVGVLP